MRKLLVLILVSLVLPVNGEEHNPDPLEGLNRSVHAFNDKADQYLLRPVAKGYQTFLPAFVRRGISNVFGNILDVDNSVNNLLQGKILAGISDLGRIVINTTLGIGGLFDPATGLGLARHDETFGQTLSVWGVPAGPYLVLPLLGPSTVTDAISRPVDSALDPLRYLYPVDHRNRLYLTTLVNDRASLLAADQVVFGDRYLFIRDAYLQRREYRVKDGQVKDSFDDF